MLTELKQHLHVKGRPCKLDLEDQLLLCLNYWREYRTLFHVGMTYGVSEATASRIVRHVEDFLINSNLFNLNKKYLKVQALIGMLLLLMQRKFQFNVPKKAKVELQW